MKSVSQQLLEYLRSNPNMSFPSGSLQRIDWKNARGTMATPRSIVRRLQELTENGLIQVEYRNGAASYSVDKTKLPVRYDYIEEKLPTGEVVMKQILRV